VEWDVGADNKEEDAVGDLEREDDDKVAFGGRGVYARVAAEVTNLVEGEIAHDELVGVAPGVISEVIRP
jgi:hypothetical protein